MLPEASQARKAIWEAVNPKTGKRRIDEAFPHAIRETTRENEMFIRFVNGSTWQVLGSDNYESSIGSPPRGIVFSEWAQANPMAWAYIRPILAENGGWSLFITTPRGKNHAHAMLENFKNSPDWFTETLTAYDMKHISERVLQTELEELQKEYGEEGGKSLFNQEYLCSFESIVVGSYYGDILEKLERGNKITAVPAIPGIPTYTGWDLGHGDKTAIWWAQVVGKEPRLVDYYENSGKGIDHYVAEIKKRDYAYEQHFLPHDAGHKSLQTGRSLKEQMILMGVPAKLLTVLGRTDLEAGISEVRQLLPQTWIDKERCAAGIECLKAYQRKWDAEKKIYANLPLHNWASHGADGLRYLAVGLSTLKPIAKSKAPEYTSYLQDGNGWMQ